jgi:hypothetical protein
MQFDPTQLMFIVDAVLNYSEHPSCANHPVIPAHLEGILEIAHKELEDMGYHFEGTVTYAVK